MFAPRFFPPGPQQTGGYVAVSGTRAVLQDPALGALLLNERTVATIIQEETAVSVKSSELIAGNEDESLFAKFDGQILKVET